MLLPITNNNTKGYQFRPVKYNLVVFAKSGLSSDTFRSCKIFASALQDYKTSWIGQSCDAK